MKAWQATTNRPTSGQDENQTHDFIDQVKCVTHWHPIVKLFIVALLYQNLVSIADRANEPIYVKLVDENCHKLLSRLYRIYPAGIRTQYMSLTSHLFVLGFYIFEACYYYHWNIKQPILLLVLEEVYEKEPGSPGCATASNCCKY